MSEEGIKISNIPSQSDWECQLFGCGDGIVLTPKKGKEPNWFWRWMQYLLFGNKWAKRKGE
jgi:hypothetical protein